MSVSSQESLAVDRSLHVASSLQVLLDHGTLGGLTDGQLLERFVQGERAVAEAAFTLLVQRHGPMVLNVCQSVLKDRHDAEDAFQATFLVLARQAGSIRREDAVASWLYGVARRLSLRSRRGIAHRRALEQKHLAAREFAEPITGPPPEPWPELYEELDRLPEPFRAAVVLCDLEGNSYDQAAELLHCPVGTIQSRLSRGRQRLRLRLERRGLGSALGVAGSGPLAIPVAHGVPPTLAHQVVRAAAGLAGGESIRALAPAAVIGLVGSELKRRLLARILTVTVALSMAALTVAGVGMLTSGPQDKKLEAQRAIMTPPLRADAGPIHVRVVDAQGKGVPGIVVHVTGFSADGLPRTLTTDVAGTIVVPRENLEQPLALIARRGDESLAWVQISDRDSEGPAGTKTDPILMKLRPLTHRVEGSVVDQQGKPVADAEVAAQSLAQGATNSSTNGALFLFRPQQVPALPHAMTDQAGRFVLILPEGANAMLGVQHPRYIGPRATVEPDDKTVSPVVMDPAGTIAGRVVDAVTGLPVPRVLLGAQLLDFHPRILGGWGSSQSDDQGRFAITGLEPGVYNLLFEKAPGRPHAAARAVEGVRVRAGQSTAALVKLIEGRPLRGVVINRATEQPVAGIQVGCYGPARPRSGAAVQSCKSDFQGTFTFHVPPGQHYIYLMEGPPFPGRLSSRTVDVPEQGETELMRLILVSPANHAETAFTKAAVPAPPPDAKTKGAIGKGAVLPQEPAPAKAAANENAKGEDKQPAPARLPELRTVTGHVRDPRGAPVIAVQVHVTPAQPPPAQPFAFADLVATDREGVFVLVGIPRQALQIHLSQPGFNSQQESLPADRDEIEYTFRLEPDASSKHRPATHRDDPIPADLRERLRFIDLSKHGTDVLADGPGGSGNDLNQVPRGVGNFDDQYFRVGEDMVHLQGSMAPDQPMEVKGIKVQAHGRKLHFLHAVQQSAPKGTEVGAYVVHYIDGSTERIPIIYGRDLVNWWLWGQGFRELPTDARVAWTGPNNISETNEGLQVRLFAKTWTNPHPEKEITTLDVISTGTLCDRFLVAATLEKDR